MIEGKKIFLYTNVYTARVLLRCIQYLNFIDSFEIILLSEIGVTEGIHFNNILIRTCDTLNECVNMCTEVLIVSYDYMPNAKKELIETLAKKSNKHYTIVDTFQNKDDYNVLKAESISSLPSIMLVALTECVQLPCWELVINKVLKSNGIGVSQEISCELKNVLDILNSCNILCSKEAEKLFDCKNENYVAVKSIHYKIKDDVLLYKCLTESRPDVLILIIPQNYNNVTDLKNVFRYKYNHDVDACVRSEFLEFVNDDGIRKNILSALRQTNTREKLKDETITLNDMYLFDTMSKIILPKVTLPDGITIL